MSYESPDNTDMETMILINQRLLHERDMLKQAYRMLDAKDVWGQLYVPTKEHIRVLVKEIENLKTQLKLGVANGDVKEEPY